MNYSKGICWIDDCRIPFVDEKENTKRTKSGLQDKIVGGKLINNFDIKNQQDRDKGRFPANLLVSDDMLNDGSVSKSEGRKIYTNEDINIKNDVYNKGWVRTASDIKDKGSNSRYYDIDVWFNNLINYI